MMDIERYFDGERLYGDDFAPEQIAAWHADEEEGYANLGAQDSAAYKYGYHAWNALHGYDHLPDGSFKRVLGFGSAYGDEFLPIISRVEQFTIVDPSAAFVRDNVLGVPATYVKPAPDGRLPLPDESFDLLTCLGVLHHIPNVSSVFGEMVKKLKPGGYLLLREPIVSMGDWRRPRSGLTKNERGIPLKILEAIVQSSGMEITRRALCGFPLTPRLFRWIRPDVYNSPVVARIDAQCCAAFAWNLRYHPRSTLQRFRPTSAFLVLRKPTDSKAGKWNPGARL